MPHRVEIGYFRSNERLVCGQWPYGTFMRSRDKYGGGGGIGTVDKTQLMAARFKHANQFPC
jgi:hypothetical protein